MPALTDLLGLDDAGFRKLFANSPVRRAGYVRFLRNVLIAAGNSGDRRLIPLVARIYADPWCVAWLSGPFQAFMASCGLLHQIIFQMRPTMVLAE